MNKFIMIATVLFVNVINCYAGTVPVLTRESAILAIIGEAEGEPYIGKVAVAEVIRRRGSLKGIYGIRAKRVVGKLYSRKVYDECARAWDESVRTDYSKGATFFENIVDFGNPSWHETVVKTTTIGHHTFFKERKQQ